MNFNGTDNYISSEGLSVAVNAAIALEKPLLIKGEPGTGKTLLAQEMADSLGKKLYAWHVKSTTKAQQGLYEYDAVARLRDSQLGDDKVHDIANYIKKGPLWQAFEDEEQAIVLIDEIDKADIEFPNDLLLELDKMEFYVYELQKKVVAKKRPIFIITSNNEKELPDAFLRRCFFHYISFPEKDLMKRIVDVHYPNLNEELCNAAMKVFYEIRNLRGLKKKPSTSELIDWIGLLDQAGFDVEKLKTMVLGKDELPYSGALLKNEQDEETLDKMGQSNMPQTRYF